MREDAIENLFDGALGGGAGVVPPAGGAVLVGGGVAPAHGVALVAYLPGRRIAGIGTIAHIVDVLSRRLTLQEQIGADVAALLVHELGATGALCRLALTHSCLIARGERKHGAVVETVAFAGTFSQRSQDRDLAFAALGG